MCGEMIRIKPLEIHAKIHRRKCAVRKWCKYIFFPPEMIISEAQYNFKYYSSGRGSQDLIAIRSRTNVYIFPRNEMIIPKAQCNFKYYSSPRRSQDLIVIRSRTSIYTFSRNEISTARTRYS